jgi:ribosomal protein S12 methylthiotransferase
MARHYWLETLGCPKNQVDSDKLTGRLEAGGLRAAESPEAAEMVVVNTCAFIETARQESIDVILSLADQRAPGASLVVTGCMAERYGAELADALPEVDVVAGFGQAFDGLALDGLAPAEVTVTLGPTRGGTAGAPSFDLLRLPRPAATAPWAYVKVAEGCDRACGFCAIPTFRGPQRSRSVDDILAEVDDLGVREVVLVAQDLAAFGRDQGQGRRALVPLLAAVARRVDRVRCLYLYPSDLTDDLVEAIGATGVAYFDLSLQHVSRPLLRRMRRWGDGDRFLDRIGTIRAALPEAAFRSNFIVGYPGETEADHDDLLDFVAEARLDWCGFFSYSPEAGTYAADLDGEVPDDLVAERLRELTDIQDAITARRRDELVGTRVEVLVDRPGIARSHREAPEIDGVIAVPDHLEVGSLVDVEIVAALGPDLEAVVAGASAAEGGRPHPQIIGPIPASTTVSPVGGVR